MIPPKLTIGLGPLREPLAKRLVKLRITPSEYMRNLLATDLGVAIPMMKPGRVVVNAVSERKVRYKR